MAKGMSKKRIMLIGLIALVIMLIGWSGICIMRGARAYDTVSIDEGWKVKLNDKVYDNVDISKFTFKNLNRLDSIEVTRLITEDLSEGYTARVKMQFCSLEVFVDDSRIFSLGTEEVKNNKFLGNGYSFVDFPYDIQGKVLKMCFIINEKSSMTDIGTMRLEKTSEAMRRYANANATSVYLNAFILVFGLALMVLGFLVKPYGHDYLSLVLIGAFSALIGNWSNCQGKIYEIFSSNLTKASTMEFLSLYTAPIPLAVFMWRRYIKEKGWRELTLRISVIVLSAFDVFAVIMHFTNVIRFPQILLSFHLIGGICLAGTIVAGVFRIRKETPSDLVVMVAFCLVAIASFMDLIRLNFQRWFVPNVDVITEVSFLPMGAIMFVVMLTASYLFSLYETVLSHAERDALTRIAYHDPLTGIYNRAKANERFKEIDQQESTVALVNFDLDGLKYVNDHFGHEEGDNYLKAVAEIIGKNFNEIGTSYRMGGDEFLCIVDPAGIFTVKQMADRFKRELKEASKNYRYDLSVSYGIAYKAKDEKKSIQELYMEADEKMYAMKARSKHSREALEEKDHKQKDTKES